MITIILLSSFVQSNKIIIFLVGQMAQDKCLLNAKNIKSDTKIMMVQCLI